MSDAALKFYTQKRILGQKLRMVTSQASLTVRYEIEKGLRVV